MFYLPLAMVTWLSIPWLINTKRVRELLLYGMFGAVLATVQDRLVLIYHLWEYRDTGLVSTHTEIALLISISAAPIFGMRFAQGLHPGNPAPWRRIWKFTAISMLPEIVGLFSGNILYHQWWNVFCSVGAYLPIWLSFWGLHRWVYSSQFSRTTESNSPQTQQQTAPGT